MNPDALLRWMRRHEVVTVNDDGTVNAACRHCAGASGHVAIDGLACYACVLRLGRLAGEPATVPIGLLADVWEAHADVMELRNCHRHGQCWTWTGWTHADTLADPAAAERLLDEASHVAAVAWATA